MLALLGTGGCMFFGPTAIRGNRLAYNDAIVATNNQQVLAMLVRTRYGETSGLLAVSSVTANMKIQSSAGAEFGYGSKTNYQGNLVPLAVGFAYEETPTISYTPVQGERYLRQLLSPLPLDLTVLMLQALRDSPVGMTVLVRKINGISNPDFLADPSVEVDPRFAHLTGLLAELARQGRLSWREEPGAVRSFALVLAGEGEAFVAQVAELYGLLGLEAPGDLGAVITLPLRLGIGSSDEPAILLETRSLSDLFNIAGASVDVPEEDLASGLAPALPPVGPAGRSIHIRRSESRPDSPLVAVQHHGSWFYVDGTDATSKLTFKLVEALLMVRIADTVDHLKSTPVLTVPVSR